MDREGPENQTFRQTHQSKKKNHPMTYWNNKSNCGMTSLRNRLSNDIFGVYLWSQNKQTKSCSVICLCVVGKSVELALALCRATGLPSSGQIRAYLWPVKDSSSPGESPVGDRRFTKLHPGLRPPSHMLITQREAVYHRRDYKVCTLTHPLGSGVVARGLGQGLSISCLMHNLSSFLLS